MNNYYPYDRIAAVFDESSDALVELIWLSSRYGVFSRRNNAWVMLLAKEFEFKGRVYAHLEFKDYRDLIRFSPSPIRNYVYEDLKKYQVVYDFENHEMFDLVMDTRGLRPAYEISRWVNEFLEPSLVEIEGEVCERAKYYGYFNEEILIPEQMRKEYEDEILVRRLVSFDEKRKEKVDWIGSFPPYVDALHQNFVILNDRYNIHHLNGDFDHDIDLDVYVSNCEKFLSGSILTHFDYLTEMYSHFLLLLPAHSGQISKKTLDSIFVPEVVSAQVSHSSNFPTSPFHKTSFSPFLTLFHLEIPHCGCSPRIENGMSEVDCDRSETAIYELSGGRKIELPKLCSVQPSVTPKTASLLLDCHRYEVEGSDFFLASESIVVTKIENDLYLLEIANSGDKYRETPVDDSVSYYVVQRLLVQAPHQASLRMSFWRQFIFLIRDEYPQITDLLAAAFANVKSELGSSEIERSNGRKKWTFGNDRASSGSISILDSGELEEALRLAVHELAG